jgi:hypothetical protein
MEWMNTFGLDGLEQTKRKHKKHRLQSKQGGGKSASGVRIVSEIVFVSSEKFS